MGGLLFKPIYFYLIQIRICRACAPSSLSLVLTPVFWLLRLSLSAWEPPWRFECVCDYTIWLFIRRSMHTWLRRTLFGCLSRSFSRALSSPISLALSKVCMQCMSFALSLSLALSRYPFHPPSRLYLSLPPAFSASLPSFQIQSPNPLFLSPTTLPQFFSYSSVFVHVSILIHIYKHIGCHKMRVGRILETLNQHLK